MQELEKNPFRQILKALSEVSEVIQRNSEINRIRTASGQTIKARKQRNLNRGNVFYRRNMFHIPKFNPNRIFATETDQN